MIHNCCTLGVFQVNSFMFWVNLNCIFLNWIVVPLVLNSYDEIRIFILGGGWNFNIYRFKVRPCFLPSLVIVKNLQGYNCILTIPAVFIRWISCQISFSCKVNRIINFPRRETISLCLICGIIFIIPSGNKSFIIF